MAPGGKMENNAGSWLKGSHLIMSVGVTVIALLLYVEDGIKAEARGQARGLLSRDSKPLFWYVHTGYLWRSSTPHI